MSSCCRGSTFPGICVSGDLCCRGPGLAVREFLHWHEGQVHVSDWFQTEIILPPFGRGCHIVTSHVIRHLSPLKRCRVGLLHIFIQHTSASLTINENADPDVPVDLSMSLDRLVPESWAYRHTCEGPDDMPAHVKSTMTGSSLSIPIAEGRLLLGTWQGIYLCEHRNHGGGRHLIATIQGQFEES